MPQDYSKLLCTGKQNAIHAADLARKIGFTDTRKLRYDISAARAEGQIICSCTHGYFIPETLEEKRQFYKSMRSRIRSAARAIHALTGIFDGLDGQMTFDDLLEDIQAGAAPES